MEQKNGAIELRFAGNERLAGFIAGKSLARLFALVGLYSNYPQPSFKLVGKTKDGVMVRKRNARTKTPCQRLLDLPDADDRVKDR